MSNLERLTELQRRLLTQSLETTPEDVTKYSISATGTSNTMQHKVSASTPFTLNDDAIAALRELFLFHKGEGHPIKGLVAEMQENANDTWSLAMDFDYA